MRKRVWMNAWDVDGREPSELIEFLEGRGLNSCSLGLSYHGGRMLQGTHPSRMVFDHGTGGLYFDADTSRFPGRLRPRVAEARTERFLGECARRGFDAQAWTVLCHSDELGGQAPECCVVNAFGERYGYALCPAREQVQDYCAELCRQIAGLEGITGLDLEAAGFMGYDHQGMHEKRGFPVPPEVSWWLSICCCDACRYELGDIAPAIRERVLAWREDPFAPEDEYGFEHVLVWRSVVQMRLLGRIREAAGRTRLNVRTAQDVHFSGGKCGLGWDELRGLADEATITFFGATAESMRKGLAALPYRRQLPVQAGFVFHGPDCATEQDVAARVGLLRGAELSGWAFYGFGMAARPHWAWLERALKDSEKGE